MWLQQVLLPRIGFNEAVIQLSNSDIIVPALPPNLSFSLNAIPLFPKSKEFCQTKFMISINEFIKNGLPNEQIRIKKEDHCYRKILSWRKLLAY
jgi:hypothetical protein